MWGEGAYRSVLSYDIVYMVHNVYMVSTQTKQYGACHPLLRHDTLNSSVSKFCKKNWKEKMESRHGGAKGSYTILPPFRRSI
jgi:hypothetical protein